MHGVISLALNLSATLFFLHGGLLVILVGTWVKDLPPNDKLHLPDWKIFIVSGLTVALFAYFSAMAAFLRSSYFSDSDHKIKAKKVKSVPMKAEQEPRAKNVCYINHIYPTEKTVFLGVSAIFFALGNDVRSYF